MAKYKDNTNKVHDAIIKLAQEKLKTAALIVERSAKQMAPVKTGTLKRSILSNWSGAVGSRKVVWPEEKRKVGNTIVHIKAGKTEAPVPHGLKAVVGTNIEYGAAIEGGTPRMAAQPYLRPALMLNLSRIKRLFGGK